MKKVGRPAKFQDEFYLMILKEFEIFSFNELAKLHNVSRATVTRWVRKGKEINEKQQK